MTKLKAKTTRKVKTAKPAKAKKTVKAASKKTNGISVSEMKKQFNKKLAEAVAKAYEKGRVEMHREIELLTKKKESVLAKTAEKFEKKYNKFKPKAAAKLIKVSSKLSKSAAPKAKKSKKTARPKTMKKSKSSQTAHHTVM